MKRWKNGKKKKQKSEEKGKEREREITKKERKKNRNMSNLFLGSDFVAWVCSDTIFTIYPQYIVTL